MLSPLVVAALLFVGMFAIRLISSDSAAPLNAQAGEQGAARAPTLAARDANGIAMHLRGLELTITLGRDTTPALRERFFGNRVRVRCAYLALGGARLVTEALPPWPHGDRDSVVTFGDELRRGAEFCQVGHDGETLAHGRFASAVDKRR
jgi:hypothetical protein